MGEEAGHWRKCGRMEAERAVSATGRGGNATGGQCRGRLFSTIASLRLSQLCGCYVTMEGRDGWAEGGTERGGGGDNCQSMANSEPSLPTDSSSFRAVVVDSLLCFVHNFRHLPHLRSVLIRHFPVPSFVRSLHLLTQLSPDPNDLLFPFCSSHSEDVHLLLHSLLLRFDRLSSSGQAPIFAASDLFSLPLRPNFVTSADTEIAGGENGTKMGRVAVEDELRHIRFMLQQIFWLQQQLPARQKNGSSNGSPSPFLDFAQQHCAVPSVTSSSAPPLSLFAQFGQSLFSSPECPTARPLPATTPKDGQTVVTNGTVSSPIVQKNRQTTTNNGKGMLSPSKSRGRLDNVVEKLTRERAISRKGTTDEGKGGEERQQRQRSETVERERQSGNMEEVKNQRDEIAHGNGGEDSEGKERQQQQRQIQQQNNAQHQQQVMGGVTTTINAAATMASSYAMRVLQQLAIGAGGLGGILEGAQQRQMDEWQRGQQATAQLTKRNELEEEEAEERDGPMLEEEDEEEDEGDTFGNETPTGERHEEREERKRTDAELEGQTMADSPTLSEGSLAEIGNGNDKEGEEKPLLCNWPNCFKRFRNKFLLKKHRFIHSGEKPHKCPFCPKKFNRRDNLLRHKKTHVQNGLSEQNGQKRRHNMLYGVSAEEALLSGMILPMDGGASTDKQRRGTKRKAKCTEKARDDGTEQ
ncbi:hypothetical protein niasHT_019704 [Heterodera trifolii]|uniref:C2H2-type domain-containing protein n=1 Tax=Heterodera trifolii TaxID=157864 RepID=A0ABD2LBY3_9BILA